MECCLSVQVTPLPFNVDFIQVATDEVVIGASWRSANS